jgi:hypothetical protein
MNINPPALTSDRAFDLAAMLFYLYHLDGSRLRLRGRALKLTSPRDLDAYLAHMLLRQGDCSLHRHPDTASTARHLRLARLIASVPGGHETRTERPTLDAGARKSRAPGLCS